MTDIFGQLLIIIVALGACGSVYNQVLKGTKNKIVASIVCFACIPFTMYVIGYPKTGFVIAGLAFATALIARARS